MAGSSCLKSGLATIKTPLNPSITASTRSRVKASPKSNGANKATQMGVENSSANNCENGIKATARNQDPRSKGFPKIGNLIKTRGVPAYLLLGLEI